MKVVDNARSAWKWFSVQAMVAAAALQGAWAATPPDLAERIPDNLVSTLSMLVLALGIVGRLVDQGK